MYYSEYNYRYVIGFVIHENPITRVDLGSQRGFYTFMRGPLDRKLNKRIRPKVQILKILGGNYREQAYRPRSMAEKETKIITLNQKLTEEELVKVKAGVKSGKICIGKPL